MVLELQTAVANLYIVRANLVGSNKGNSFLQRHAVKLIFQHITLKVGWTSQNI